MNPNEKKLYEKLSKQFALAPTDDHPAPAATSPFKAEDHLRTLMRPVFQEPGRFGASWDYLIGAVESHGARLERSGGGLIVVRDRTKITTSSIANRYSLSKLEKLLGPCPILKAPAAPAPRDLLIQDAKAIMEKHVAQGHGRSWIEPDLNQTNIHIAPRIFPNNVGQPQKYYVLVRDGISVPISSIAKKPYGKPVYSMWLLEKLDQVDATLQKSKMLAEQQRKTAIENKQWCIGWKSYEAYQRESSQQKQIRVEKLSLFAAIVQFIKHKMEKQDVHTYSPGTNQLQSDIVEPSQSQSVLTM